MFEAIALGTFGTSWLVNGEAVLGNKDQTSMSIADVAYFGED